MEIKLSPGEKVYFASDFHLGFPTREDSRDREKKIVRWLEVVSHDAKHIFLVGDIFDFWFEYQSVIPKGYIRFQGKIAELVDKGIEISFFTGNHDLWIFDYFTKELGVKVYRKPQTLIINGTKMLLGHGDGLGPGDYSYKLLKVVFENKVCQWLFGFLHPNVGIFVANYWSTTRKKKQMKTGKPFNEENELLWKYAESIEQEEHFDYYIFGHRHLRLDLKVGENSRYINIGEWLTLYTYGVFDGKKMDILTFDEEKTQ